jgi:hypothetical protein
MGLSEWYRQFYAMKEALFAGPPDAVQQARAFYETMVGDPAIVRLTVALRLQVTEGGQDWAFEVADSGRLEEFLDFYEHGPLDEQERYHLMELIVASLEDYLQGGAADPGLIARFQRDFTESFETHRDIAEYLAGVGSEDGGHFAITPLMRQIWEEQQTEQGQF